MKNIKIGKGILLAALAAMALVLGVAFGSASTVAPTTASPKAELIASGGTPGKPTAKPTKTTSTTTSPTSSTTTTTSSTTTTTSTTTSPTSTTTTTSGTWDCVAQIGDACGAYSFAGIPNSNGYNTYVSNQAVNVQSGTKQTVYVNSPSDWKMVSDSRPYGYEGVQTYPDIQQLFNNWPWTGNGCGSNCSDTPVNSLSELKVNYSETSPKGNPNDIYQFSPDVWLDNYGSDIMFWVDIQGRCNEGAFGGTVLGNAVIDGQNWTVHRYGDYGDEIIFVLDGPGGSGTCAQQSSGTINIKAGIDWLIANGFVQGEPVLSQLNTGWEITSAENATFTVSGYSITAAPL